MAHRICVVGYGGMGGRHVCHALSSDVLELAGIYDIKEERLKVAESEGIRTYKSLDDVPADPGVEIITVATPNDVHNESDRRRH